MDRREAVLRELNLYPLWVRRASAPADIDQRVPLPDAAQHGQAAEPIAATYTEHRQQEVVAPFPVQRPAVVEEKAAELRSVPNVHASTPWDVGWPELKQRVRDCTACRLRAGCTQTVFGVGDQNADWLFIGEGPGADEDAQGEPFVGQAGRLLDNMLPAIKLTRGKGVYIGNIVKCRPPGNRAPEADEIAQCLPYLQHQIELIQPKLIIALGKTASNALLGRDATLGSLRGKVHDYNGIPLIITYHPAYLLRTPSEKAKTWKDLCLAVDVEHGAGRMVSD